MLWFEGRKNDSRKGAKIAKMDMMKRGITRTVNGLPE